MSQIKGKGVKINKKRIKKGWSLRDFSKKTGINISNLSSIENKNKSVMPKTAKSICEALGEEFDELFEII
jgi:transcriptional regulator with XRE-family HTH domain